MSTSKLLGVSAPAQAEASGIDLTELYKLADEWASRVNSVIPDPAKGKPEVDRPMSSVLTYLHYAAKEMWWADGAPELAGLIGFINEEMEKPDGSIQLGHLFRMAAIPLATRSMAGRGSLSPFRMLSVVLTVMLGEASNQDLQQLTMMDIFLAIVAIEARRVRNATSAGLADIGDGAVYRLYVDAIPKAVALINSWLLMEETES